MKRYDIHVHLAGIGDGSPCRVSTRMRSHFVYKYLLRAQKIDKTKPVDPQFVQSLERLMQTDYLEGCVLLALDGAVNEQGKIDPLLSHAVVPNEYLFEVCRKHKKFLPGVSINPYRSNALELLQEAIHQGAVIVKWLPNMQLFDPSDKRCLPFYKLLSENQVPLIAHTGCEHTFPDAKQSLGNATLYKTALDMGVIIIMSHCGTSCFFHKRYDCSKTIFEYFKTYDNLYADTSALCSILKFYYLHKLDFLNFYERIVHGSDYPIPASTLAFIYPLGVKKTLKLMKNKNLIERDILIKKAMGLPDAIFTNADKILEKRINYWYSSRGKML